MSHYFIEDKSLKSDRREFEYYFGGKLLTFATDAGIFSKGHLDEATNALIENIPRLKGSLLDLGCGCGVVGTALGTAYGLRVTFCDVNPAALRLARENSARNGLAAEFAVSDIYSGVSGPFDTIALNPPIHAGKDVTYAMYDGAPDMLSPGGAIYVVTFKKHGADGAAERLRKAFGSCDTIYKEKGLCVFRSVKGR